VAGGVVTGLAWSAGVVMGSAYMFLCLEGCPPPQTPAPVPPDAADGAPPLAQDASVEDGAAPVPSDPCSMACAVMARVCGPQSPLCLRVWAHIDSSPGAIRKPNGMSLKCLDVASADTVDQIRALGVPCP
jgi:hypothetical protein